MDNKHLLLFSTCIPVKGNCRGIIYDIQRQDKYIVPNQLIEVINLLKNESIKKSKEKIDSNQHYIFEEYIQFVIENELGFFADKEEIDNYPELNMEWDHPGIITNSIIELEIYDKIKTLELLNELSDLGCKCVQYWVYNLSEINIINNICNIINSTAIETIELYIQNNNKFKYDKFIEVIEEYQIIEYIIFFNSKSDKIIYETKHNNRTIALTTKILSVENCGVIDENYFQLNLDFFCEAQNYNTCLNRKVCINIKGEIKNCLAMKETFGNINNNSLKDVVVKKEFQKLWTISKDQIKVCKDCEYRYCCSDCRAFTENNDLYSKPLKCKFNPYFDN